jgi:hypothetical protein
MIQIKFYIFLNFNIHKIQLILLFKLNIFKLLNY